MTRSPSASSRPLGLLLLAACTLLLSALLAAPLSVSAGVTSVETTFLNSTSFVFSVAFDGLEVGVDNLKVLIQPEDGNATEALFVSLPSPMEVAVRELKPDSQYTFTFSTAAGGNSTASTFALPTVRTHSVGPQIVGFFAADDSPGTGADTLFSVDDTITLAFDGPTNVPGPLDNAAQVNAIFSFSQPIGAEYRGEWQNDRTLRITIVDVGQSDPMLGYLTVTVIGNIVSPDGKSDISTSSSPPLIGSWANRQGAFEYFRPTPPGLISPLENPTFKDYHIATTVNTDVRLPMSLSFPPNARTGYMVSATVLYPKGESQLGFALNGQNFSYAPSANIGTKDPFPNTFLSTIVPTVTLTPRPDYTGYSCVSYQLFDRANGYKLVSTVYMNVLVNPPARMYIPQLTASSGGMTTNPIELAKTYKTPLIIGLCTVFGFFLLLGLGIFAWKKYRGGRDARDFEANSLTSDIDQPGGADAGPTRRFYYDAKV